jgi:glucan 1,3-beta-glucosidase
VAFFFAQRPENPLSMPSLPITRPSSAVWRILLVVHLLALLVLGGVVARQLQSTAMHDLQLADGERLKCVSYAPYRLPGQTPFDATLVISPAQIAADLAALAPMTECVRVYSIDQGLDQVPALAREAGLKVLLGVWIGPNRKRNAAELERAIALANEYADVVRVLIVGNEVLLRRERTEDELRELLEYAQARTSVPVTYADVWEFWLKHPRLANAVDLVTVHILPFWEDDPVAIEDAVEHVGTTFEKVRHAFDKPLLIGETGWPSAGRQREASLPSRVNQARYIREFVHRAHAEGWNYNLIEAIDQPWKRRLEGTVGGYWGILGIDLAPKFPLAGPFAERASAARPAFGAALGALLCLALAATARGAGARAPLRLAAITALGAVAGVTAVLHAEHAQRAYRDALEWLLLGTVGTLALMVPLTLARWSADSPLGSAAAAWARLRATPAALRAPATALALLRGVLLFAAAVAALLLFVDPRYRDFPTLLYLMPALVFGPLDWLRASRHGAEERICALVLAVAVTGRWLSEPANPEAIGWLVTGLILAVPTLRRLARQHQ